MADFNQSVILDAIRRSSAGQSRVQLAEATGLSAQTISNIVRRLLDADLIGEAGREVTGPGKPRTMLGLNPSGRYALGVHLDPTVTTAVMLDLVGTVVARDRIATPLGQEPATVIDAIARSLEGLIASSGVGRDRISGLGIAAPGPIDPIGGMLVDPPHLHGWHRVPLRDALAERLGLPTILDKDVTAAAIAEIWTGEAAVEPGSFVFLYLGTGVGAGLVIDDEIIRGSLDNSGEIGHIIVDPAGPECSCGNRGCVAVTCTPEAMVREARDIIEGPEPGEVWDTVRIDAAFSRLSDAAADGDPGARAVIDRCAVRIARALAVIANLLDVDRVILGGPFWPRVDERFLTIVPAELDRMRAARSIHPVSVAGSRVGAEVVAIGAATLVLNRGLSPRTRSLLLPVSAP
ncbi:MAG: ROK family transcriptional regulator [Salinibacterium sp.]|nr:ROK family transcriptional regulator [Salinibacterium sp.]